VSKKRSSLDPRTWNRFSWLVWVRRRGRFFRKFNIINIEFAFYGSFLLNLGDIGKAANKKASINTMMLVKIDNFDRKAEPEDDKLEKIIDSAQKLTFKMDDTWKIVSKTSKIWTQYKCVESVKNHFLVF